ESDIANCFGAIPHSALMSAVEERICDRRLLKLLRAMLRAGVLEAGAVRHGMSGTPQGGVVTAPTQQVTWVIGAGGGGDGVADRDAVVVEEYFSDDELNDALAFLDGQVLGVLGEAGEETLEVLWELEAGL